MSPSSQPERLSARTAKPTCPKREKFFALKFCRAMQKNCLASTIGTEAVWLLAIIALTQDASRYRGGVSFFSENLADQCGVSLSSMKRARKRAIDSGWLHHVPGCKRRAGMYWVMVPDVDLLGQFDPLSDPLSGPVLSQQVAGERPSIEPASGPPSSPSPSLSPLHTQPPTLDDVKRECAEKGYIANPTKFFANYQAKGWDEIRDWKAMLLVWDQTDRERKGKGPGHKSNGKPDASVPDSMRFAQHKAAQRAAEAAT